MTFDAARVHETDSQDGNPAAVHPLQFGFSSAALDRLKSDPFLLFDASRVAVRAYFLWLNGAPGDAFSHWVHAERLEVLQQAKEKLVFGSSDRNGLTPGSFYEHYRLVASWSALHGERRLPLGPREPRRCCICGRGKPEASFRTVAHVIPEMFGRANLLSNEECDDCNGESGKTWETELGALTLGARAFSAMGAKKGGTPKAKIGAGYVGGGSAGITRVTSSDQEVLKITGPGRAEIQIPQLAARPSDAALAIAKMAWLMLPTDVRQKHPGIRSMLRGERQLPEQPTPLFDIWMACRVPTTVNVWERVGDEELAKVVVLLAFGHVALLWACPDEETGMNRDVIIPPLPATANHAGGLTARRFMGKRDERTRAGARTIALEFQSYQRVHAATEQPVRVVLRHEQGEACLDTFASSPAGASEERAHFVLRGGELVGQIELEDVSGTGEWTWMHSAFPTEGDLPRTVAVLRATLNGAAIEVWCPTDGAVFFTGSFPPCSPDEAARVCRVTEMAYYVGVVNRKFGKAIELASFSHDDLMLARWLALGVTHGGFQERPSDGRCTIEAEPGLIKKLRDDLGTPQTFSLGSHVTHELLGTEIDVGPTRLVVIDPKLDGDWETLLTDAERDGSASVVFLCERIQHVFERHRPETPSSEEGATRQQD